MTEQTLKPGWRRVKFGDVVRLNTDRVADPVAAGIERYVGLEHLIPEDLHIRTWGNVADGTTFTNLFKPGQVLFGKRRAYQRKVALVDFSGVCSGDIYVFETRDPNILVAELLPFICQTEGFFEYAVGTSAGSLSPRTNWTQLAGYEVSLPPLEEQRRIADLLWAIELTMKVYKDVLRVADKLDGASLSRIFESDFTWEKKPLYSLADVAYGLTVESSRRNMSHQSPYLRVANVGRNSLDLTEVKLIGSTSGDNNRYVLSLNDILIVEGHANLSEIGRAALWEGQIENCLHQNHILRVRILRPDILLPKFLLGYINGPAGKKYMRSRAKSTSGLNTINSTIINTMEIPVPPIGKQQEIIEMLETFGKSINAINVRMCNLITMKKQLLTARMV